MKAWIKRLVLMMVLALPLLGGTYHSVKDNTHAVIAGAIYRSAELSKAGFIELISEKGIRSIINLRGHNPHKLWYQQELAAVEQTKIQHFNLRLSARKYPKKTQIARLIHLLKTVPRPVLIHCSGGADRAGLASAIALILETNARLEDIEAQFSWLYLVMSSRSAGKQYFRRYKTWLRQQGVRHSRAEFHRWRASR